MWYFSYDPLASWRQIDRFYRQAGLRTPLPLSRHPALVRNYRLCFPVFSEHFDGGVASIVEANGKYVAGALFDLPRSAVEKLDELYGRSTDWQGRETGTYRRIEVPVRRLDSQTPFIAIAHQVIGDEGNHVPPSAKYVGLLVAAACDVGLSSLWIEQLLSFIQRQGVTRGGSGSVLSIGSDAEEGCTAAA